MSCTWYTITWKQEQNGQHIDMSCTQRLGNMDMYWQGQNEDIQVKKQQCAFTQNNLNQK